MPEETQAVPTQETGTQGADASAQETPQSNGATAGTQVEAAKTFTQADVDRLITERLEREKGKATKAAEAARAEAERKAAEEQGKFKELYEAQQAKLAEAERKAHDAELRDMRRAAAEKVGLPSALAERLRGETPEDLEADAKAVLAALPKPSAPNINNGVGGNGQPTGGMDDTLRREYAARLGVSEKFFKPTGVN